MPQLTAAGRFKATVLPVDSYLGESGTGSLFVGLPLIVSDGPHTGENITAKLYLTEKTADRTIETLADVFGFDGDMDALSNGTITFEGLECSITTEMEAQENKPPRCVVKWVNKVNAAGSAKVADLLAASRDKFKALAAKKLAESGREALKPRTKPVAQPDEGNPADIPF